MRNAVGKVLSAKLRGLVALLCLALFAAACGGSDGAEGGETEDTATQAAEDTATEAATDMATGDAGTEDAGTESATETATAAAGGESVCAEYEGAEMETVGVGITSWHTWYWWLMGAREEGLMEPYGVELDIVTFQNTGQIAAGVISDSVQIGLPAPEQTFTLQEQSPNLVMIGSNISTSPYTVLGAGDITEIEDLQDATIGVTAEGASADYFTARIILGTHGMEAGTDYSFVNAGPPAERAAAMAAGELQSVLNFEPAALQLIDEGANILDRAANYDQLSDIEVNILVATTDWMEANPDLAQRFACGYIASIEWLYDEANRDRAVELLMGDMNISEEHAQETYDRFVGELQAWDRDGMIDPERLEQTRANAEAAGLEGMPAADDLDWRYDNSLMQAASGA